jgi:hypothetical protein
LFGTSHETERSPIGSNNDFILVSKWQQSWLQDMTGHHGTLERILHVCNVSFCEVLRVAWEGLHGRVKGKLHNIVDMTNSDGNALN